jgi:lipopolysaccharide/colanic/teichoic acid biosynthesis glycosyltransferase
MASFEQRDGIAIKAHQVEGETPVKISLKGRFADAMDEHFSTHPTAYFARKATLTRIAGAAMLIIASPLILLLVVLVRLTSPGPGLYRQARCGRGGKEFMMLKIRTMYQDAESLSGPVWCKPRDSRITPLGKLLRLLHLDELPQLVNVARGEMDLIGPRPERPVFVAKLQQTIPNYTARLQVLPGVTGLAQINLPPDETMDCVRRKLLLDCAYIRQASFFLDVRILACTFLRMFGIRHGHAAKWMGVQRHVTISAGQRACRPTSSWQNWQDSTYVPDACLVNGHADGLKLVLNGVQTAAVMDPPDPASPEGTLSYLAPRPR